MNTLLKKQLKQQAWILLLGTAASGKTQLLTHVTSAKKQQDTPFFSWWSTDQAVFIDPVGALTHDDLETAKPQWTHLMQCAKRHCRRQPIQEIILTIDAPALATEKKRIALQTQLTHAVQLIQSFQKKLSFTIIMTQCDTIPGFCEFFDNLTEADREKVMGVYNKPEADLSFSPLINKINGQLLHRLHQEPNIEKKRAIQLFPLQLEAVTKQLIAITSALPYHEQSCVNGLFLTSSKQHNQRIDFIKAIKQTQTITSTQRPYFVKQLIDQTIQNAVIKYRQHTQRQRWSLATLGLMLVTITTLTLFWHITYEKTQQILSTLQQNTIQRPLLSSNAHPWLNTLNVLQQDIKTLDSPTLRMSSALGFTQPATLKKNLTQLYETQLQTRFIPFLEAQLDDALRKSDTNPYALYRSIKTYLMLIEHRHQNPEEITAWFQQRWLIHYPKQPGFQNSLLQHLRYTLAHHFVWPNDTITRYHALNTLAALPPAAFDMLILQSAYSNQQAALFNHDNSPQAFNFNTLTLPELYHPANFQLIYNVKIPAIVNHANKYHWIFDQTDIATTSIDTRSNDAIIMEMRKRYLTAFSQAWLHLIPNIQLTPPKNFAALAQAIAALTNPETDFIRFLKIIVGNVRLHQEINNENLTAITQLIHPTAVTQRLHTQLQALQTDLQHLQNSSNIDHACYQYSLMLFKHPDTNNVIIALSNNAKTLPNPLREWVNNITQYSLSLIFAHAKTYINSLWNTTILPEYQDNLAHQFPFNTQATQDARYDAFLHFFGADGSMQQFFTHYISPFVNTQQTAWHWKTVLGKNMGFSENTLHTFMQMHLIHDVFFAGHSNMPGFHYILTLAKHNTSQQNVALNLEGQLLTFDEPKIMPTILHWPGPNPGQITLQINTPDGTQILKHFTGPWAWFHFLNTLKIKQAENTQNFTLSLTNANTVTQFTLTMDAPLNPAIPGLLSSFQCQKNL